MKSRILLPLAACGVVSLLLLACLELTARLLADPDPLTPGPPGEVDPQFANPYVRWANPWCYVHLPGARYVQRIGDRRFDYAINAQGFRGPEVAPKSARPRLVVVGDSFCEGHGSAWDDAFVQRLAQGLEQDGWETVNAGMQGASPLYYAANAPRYLAFQPDAVLLVLYDNDLWEDRVYATQHHAWPRLLQPERFQAGHAPGLLDHSRVAAVLRRALAEASPPPVERLMDQHARTDTPYPADLFPPRVELYLAQPGELDMRWERSKAYLDLLADALAARGVALAVAQVSWHFQNPELAPAFREQAQELARRQAQWAQARSIPFLVVADVVHAAMQQQGYHALAWEGDNHPTPAGHQLLAEQLAPWLHELLASSAVAQSPANLGPNAAGH